jgi:hypothetical protein
MDSTSQDLLNAAGEESQEKANRPASLSQGHPRDSSHPSVSSSPLAIRGSAAVTDTTDRFHLMHPQSQETQSSHLQPAEGYQVHDLDDPFGLQGRRRSSALTVMGDNRGRRVTVELVPYTVQICPGYSCKPESDNASCSTQTNISSDSEVDQGSTFEENETFPIMFHLRRPSTMPSNDANKCSWMPAIAFIIREVRTVFQMSKQFTQLMLNQ